MPRIDIDKLTEAELVDLNHRIVERLRVLNHMRAHVEMLEFRIGDRVTFQPQGRAPVVGMLTRYNRKTVTVITDDGHHWNVSPQFLRRVGSSVIDESDDTNVVRFKPKRSVPCRLNRRSSEPAGSYLPFPGAGGGGPRSLYVGRLEERNRA